MDDTDFEARARVEGGIYAKGARKVSKVGLVISSKDGT
jgi:hypothetical protein